MQDTLSPIPNASGIYKITCTVTKKIYIGSAVNLHGRRNNHFSGLRRNKHCNPHLQRAWNKYGENAFTFEVLELVLPMSMTAREQYWFNKLKPFGKRGYNIAPTAGSALGREMSPEIREKHRQSMLGKAKSLEHREKLRQASLGQKHNRGKKHTAEQNEQHRQALLGRKQSPELIEKRRQTMLGRKQSLETREKIRQSALARGATPPSQRGRKRSPETQKKIKQAAKKREACAKKEQTRSGTP